MQNFTRSVIAILFLIVPQVKAAPPDPAPWTTIEGTVLVAGSADEGLVYDPASGNYILTYAIPEGLYQTTYYPPTKIEPTIESFFSPKDSDIRYRYNITNGAGAQQPLVIVRLFVTKARSTVYKPDGWEGGVGGRHEDPRDPDKSVLYSLGWGSPLQGIAAGETLSGFAYDSRDLPGVGIVEMEGGRPFSPLKGEPKGKVGKQWEELKSNEFVTLLAPMPLISAFPAPNTFHWIVTLTSLRDHFQQLLDMQLVESVFADQLTKTLDAAIDALKVDDGDSARSHLEQFRIMIDEAQHADDKATLEAPINKLAARVLRFDSEHVKRRL